MGVPLSAQEGKNIGNHPFVYVEVSPVIEQEVNTEIELVGTGQPYLESVVVSDLTGIVNDMLVEEGDLVKVILEGEDVSGELRKEETGNAASKIAALPRVREALLRRQRAFSAEPGLVADGRDMGTVVFPQAEAKIFLDASAEERANRRLKQLQDKGLSVRFDHLLSEIQERDDRDRNRAIAPLCPADDALVRDSTSLSIDEVVVKALDYIESKLSQ